MLSAINMLYEGRKASVSLKITIVGGGIGGLSAAHCLNQAGHRVTVIDPRDLPAEFGAGVQLSPNVTRILYKWGLKPELNKLSQIPTCGYLHHFDSGEKFSSIPYASLPVDGDGSPFYGVYRPDLVTMLYDLVKGGIEIVKGKVVSVDPSAPSVTLESGEVLVSNLVIGADGVKSVVRPTIMADKPVISGHTVYRALISVDEMMQDPELSKMSIDDLYGWLGPRMRFIAYGVGHRLYNLVMLVPDVEPEGPWSVPADLEELKACFKDWEPRIQKILSLIKSATKYKLVVRAPLDNWIHESGRVVLLGDSAHAMLPYYAQGAAMAIEDSAILGSLFSHISDASQIKSYLEVYQELRLARSNATMAKSLENATTLNVAHQKQPKSVLKPMNGEPRLEGKLQQPEKQNFFTEKQRAEMQYGYDAYKEVDAWWQNNSHRLESRESVA